MYSGQPLPHPYNNDTAIKLLWAGMISYFLGLITPQYIGEERYFIDTNLYTWNLLSPLGLIFIVLGIVMNYVATTKAKLFEGVKKFSVSGAFLVFIPALAIQSYEADYHALAGRDIVDPSIGYYALWIGIILSMIGSFKAVSISPYMHQQFNAGQPWASYSGQQNYQYQPFNNQSQNVIPNTNTMQRAPPMSPPAYVETNPLSDQNEPNESQQQSSEKSNFCTKCGYKNELGVNFCVNCGFRFNTEKI